MFTKHPDSNGNITTVEGNNVTLICEATGNGRLKYLWRRVSGSLLQNVRGRKTSNLTIYNITVSDNGQYYCEVNNGGDSVFSMRVQVTAKSESLIVVFVC